MVHQQSPHRFVVLDVDHVDAVKIDKSPLQRDEEVVCRRENDDFGGMGQAEMMSDE